MILVCAVHWERLEMRLRNRGETRSLYVKSVERKETDKIRDDNDDDDSQHLHSIIIK